MTLLFKNSTIPPYSITRTLPNGNVATIFVEPNKCDCVAGKEIPDEYTDHTDPIWDYYTYAERTQDGIECPSIMPDNKNQSCSVAPIGKNSNCWVYELFPNSSGPNFSNQSANYRSYGADYFTTSFLKGVFTTTDCDYGETCLESAQDDTFPDGLYISIEEFEECKNILNISSSEKYIEIARRKIGRRVSSQSQSSFISPKHVTICHHCTFCADQDNCYTSIRVITDDIVRDIGVKILNPTNDALLLELQRRDMYVGEIQDPNIEFPSYFTHYVNPYTIQNYLQTIPNGSPLLKDGFIKFSVNAQGHFYIVPLQFDRFRNTLPIDLSYYESLTGAPIVSKIKDIDQPFIDIRLGSSGTHFNFYTKDNITLWPVGAAYGQYLGRSWKTNSIPSINLINDFLIQKGYSPLIEYTNIDNIYKLSDFVPFDDIPGDIVESQRPILVATQDSPLQKNPSTSFPYGSRKENNLEKNYTYLGFKPGILLQSAELNELQDNLIIQNSLNVEYALNWPILGKQYQSNNTIDEQTKTLLTGMPDENYIFPIPNSNYCFPYSPSLVSVNLTSPSILYIVLKDGWYNIPLNGINYWYYMEEQVSIKLTVTNEIDKTLYLDLQQVIVNSSFIPTEEGYDFNDKSNRFINPITDGADRVKLLATFTEFPENTAIPLLKVRRGEGSVGSNRILVQTMNNCKISDINI